LIISRKVLTASPYAYFKSLCTRPYAGLAVGVGVGYVVTLLSIRMGAAVFMEAYRRALFGLRLRAIPPSLHDQPRVI